MYEEGEESTHTHPSFLETGGDNNNLIVLSVGLSLGIKNTRPVICLKVSLVVDIDLNLKNLALGLDGVGGNTLGIEETTNQLSKTRGAPAHHLTSLEAELGSKDGI